jgi:hypothetical protein
MLDAMRAAGLEANAAWNDRTPPPRGPGIKPRDDSGVHSEVSKGASPYSHEPYSHKPYSHSIVPGGLEVTS